MTNIYELYISPAGNDQNTGSISEPLKTLDEAKKRVKDVNEGEIIVYIRGGEYHVSETTVFSLEDSGSDTKKITYKNYQSEKPIFTSGVKISGWVKLDHDIDYLPECAKGNVWYAPINDEHKKILTLYDGEKRLTRAHSEFFMPAITHEYDRLDSLSIADKNDWELLKRVDFKEGQIRDYDNVSDVEIRCRPVPWTADLLPLESVDTKNNVAWLKVPATTPLCAKPRGIRVENAIDYLDAPNKWCVDHSKSRIYYWPESGTVSDNIMTPTLKEFIKVEGCINYSQKEDTPVKNIHFEGLSFTHGRRDETDEGYKGWGIQHDWEMFDKDTAILRFRGAEDCSVKKCYFHSTSGTGIRLDLHCQNILLENNMLDDIGSMGILLCGYGPGTKDVSHHNIVRNNIVTRCGQVIWHGHGIFLWQSGNNIIEHNKIHHSARKAIGICGVRVTILKNRHIDYDEAAKTIRWNEIESTIDNTKPVFERYLPYLHSRDNVVRKNEIYRVLEKLGDGSALNISGAGTGNLIKNNYVHHMATHDASGAMRVDDWQCGTTFEGNIIYKCNLSAIVRKNYNHIINNIIVDVNCRKGFLKFASYPDEEASYGSIIRNNIFYESGKDVLFYGEGYLVSDGATYPKHCIKESNIFYCAGNTSLGQKHIIDNDEVNAEFKDPKFVNISNQDFSLEKDSPALKLGFKQITQDDIGLTDEFPQHLRELEYHEDECEDETVYDRGRNEEIENYEWW